MYLVEFDIFFMVSRVDAFELGYLEKSLWLSFHYLQFISYSYSIQLVLFYFSLS